MLLVLKDLLDSMSATNTTYKKESTGFQKPQSQSLIQEAIKYGQTLEKVSKMKGKFYQGGDVKLLVITDVNIKEGNVFSNENIVISYVVVRKTSGSVLKRQEIDLTAFTTDVNCNNLKEVSQHEACYIMNGVCADLMDLVSKVK